MVCALPSTTSAKALASLFGRFTGTTAQSESSSAYMSRLWLLAFPDRPDRSGTLEASRFSCCPEGTQFLGVPGVFDYAGPGPGSRSNAISRRPAQDSRSGWSRFSFPVGLFHPLQHAGLSRRTLSPMFSPRRVPLLVPREKCRLVSGALPGLRRGGNRRGHHVFVLVGIASRQRRGQNRGKYQAKEPCAHGSIIAETAHRRRRARKRARKRGTWRQAKPAPARLLR